MEVRMDTTQLLKGVADVAVLATIEQEEGYGYDVVRRLRGAGLTDIAEATVYGTLRRLFQAGLLTSYVVASDAGPHRKYYGLNDVGRAQLAQSRATWTQFVKTMDVVLTGEKAA
jgi:PadR family transcriptional regulator PadR